MRKFFFAFSFFVCGALLAGTVAGTAYAQLALPTVTPQTFTLQIKTILDKPTADEELQKVLKLGYKAYLEEYTIQAGQKVYKLRTGKYANRPEAVAAAAAYEAKEGAMVMIVTAREDAPLPGDVPPGQKAAPPDMAGEKKDAGKKTVKVTVKDAEKPSLQNSLAQKVAALKRGEMPVQDTKKTMRRPDDKLWYTLQTNTEQDKHSTERRINQLRDKGYDAYCVEAPLQNGKTQFKIRFGKYGSAEEAGQAAQQFYTRERRGCLVVKVTPSGDTEAGPAGAAAAPAAAEQMNEQQEEIEPKTPPQAAKSPAQKTVMPEDEEQAPAAEMPSEPEPLQQAKKRAQKGSAQGYSEQAASADNDAEPMKAADEPPALPAPERLTKIYAYREESGALNLTNRFEDIPEAVRKNIEHIALFPVHFNELSKNSSRLTLDADGERTEIILAGFTMPKNSGPARAYLEALKTKPLRLKYNPWQKTKDGATAGRLFLKEGSYINLDMVRKGLGECNTETLAPDQQDAFRQAQEAAKRERAGMWAN